LLYKGLHETNTAYLVTVIATNQFVHRWANIASIVVPVWSNCSHKLRWWIWVPRYSFGN